MKKLLLLLMVTVAACLSVNAESTIYVFLKSMSNTDTRINIDGQEVCNLNGTVKRTIQPGYGIVVPFITREACFRKITLNNEERVVVSVSIDYTIPSNGKVNTYKAEYPLDLESGENYYLQVTSNGLNDIQIKDPKEKDVKKWLKKWEELTPISL